MINSPDVASDMRKLLVSLEGKPSKTICTYAGAVKVFLQDNGIKLKDEDWKKIRRRGYMPKRVKPAKMASQFPDALAFFNSAVYM